MQPDLTPGSPVDPAAAPLCRSCNEPAAHFCQECAEGSSGFSGYYCEPHAARHNRIVRQSGGSVLALPLFEAA